MERFIIDLLYGKRPEEARPEVTRQELLGASPRRAAHWRKLRGKAFTLPETKADIYYLLMAIIVAVTGSSASYRSDTLPLVTPGNEGDR